MRSPGFVNPSAMAGGAQKKVHFVQADVFTDTPFGGNPVAVVPDASALSPEEMQKIAREMNLSETAFILPAEDPGADFRTRFFTPRQEIPFAGHPTLGAAYILAQRNRFRLTEPATRITQQTRLGVLPVELKVRGDEIERVILVEPKHGVLGKITREGDLRRLAAGLSLQANQLDRNRFPVEVVSTGLSVILVPLRSLTAVMEIQIQPALIEEICENHGAQGVMAFSLMTVQPSSSVHARMFAPSLGVNEDPATGSASGALGAYLVRHNAVPVSPVTRIISEQGYEMDRPSTIHIEVESRRDEITQVRVGGQVITVLEGTLSF